MSPDNNENQANKDVDSILEESQTPFEEDVEVTVDATLENAIETYRKLREQNGPLSDKELDNLDKECEIIRNREIIMTDIEHEIKELESN